MQRRTEEEELDGERSARAGELRGEMEQKNEGMKESCRGGSGGDERERRTAKK